MYSKTVLIGNLTKDIELRYLPSGSAIAKGSIATSYKYKAQDGEQKDEVCFLDFNIFGKIAEVASKYLHKGSKVLLEGRLVLEQWTAQDGTNRSKHSLRVEVMKMLDSKSDTNNQQNSQQVKPTYENSQGQQVSQEEFKRGENPIIDINEDEIPF